MLIPVEQQKIHGVTQLQTVDEIPQCAAVSCSAPVRQIICALCLSSSQMAPREIAMMLNSHIPRQLNAAPGPAPG